MTSTINPIDQLKLKRYPLTKDQSLKAWNAADEYLIDWCNENNSLISGNILLINDQFGALCCYLSNYNPYCWTDSFLSKTAIERNLKANSLEANSTTYINQCDQFIPEHIKFDLVIIRIPKHNSLLSFQLKSIVPYLHPDTKIVSAGMTKEIHKSNLNLFESIIGPTKTSLAKKKARLIFSNVKEIISGYSIEDLLRNCSNNYKINQYGLSITGLPGVFSRESLDIGSRVLLQYMPATKEQQKLIDLGCGTGVLGTYAAKQNPELEVTFTDESWLAVENAKQTFTENTQSKANCYVTDVLAGLDNHYYDFILCNPPFHQQNVQTLSIANKMFKESARKLTSNGELRVVANRHLNYRPMLKKYFAEVAVISKDPKFMVWLATK